MKKDRGILERKSSFQIPWLPFVSQLDLDFYIFAVANTFCQISGAFIRFMKSLFSEAMWYLCKADHPTFYVIVCHVCVGALITVCICLISIYLSFIGYVLDFGSSS